MTYDERVPSMAEVDALNEELRVVLRGRGPLLQGAALADAVAMFWAGHHPELRPTIIEQWIECARGLVGPCEDQMREHYGGRLPWDKES